jgi:hypothetical protein
VLPQISQLFFPKAFRKKYILGLFKVGVNLDKDCPFLDKVSSVQEIHFRQKTLLGIEFKPEKAETAKSALCFFLRHSFC